MIYISTTKNSAGVSVLVISSVDPITTDPNELEKFSVELKPSERGLENAVQTTRTVLQQAGVNVSVL